MAPGLTKGSTLQSDLDAELNLEVTVSSPGFMDPGQLDEHTFTVEWGDGAMGQGVVGNPITRVYPLSPGSPSPIIYPVTIEIADDDTGSGKYRMESMSVNRNDDDDEGNLEEDRNDMPGSPDEDDLRALDLSDIIANRPEPDGTIFLDYSYTGENEGYSSGNSIIRLWGDALKTTPIGIWDFYKGWELPDGLASVWVEGIQFGEDMIRLWWEAEELMGNWESQRQSPYQGYRIALGSVLVGVQLPTPGMLAIEESYWGTPNEWYGTDDDKILWRHNSHQVRSHSERRQGQYDLPRNHSISASGETDIGQRSNGQTTRLCLKTLIPTSRLVR